MLQLSNYNYIYFKKCNQLQLNYHYNITGLHLDDLLCTQGAVVESVEDATHIVYPPPLPNPNPEGKPSPQDADNSDIHMYTHKHKHVHT